MHRACVLAPDSHNLTKTMIGRYEEHTNMDVSQLKRQDRIRLSLKRYWYEKGFDFMSRLYVLTNLVTIAVSIIYVGTSG